MSKPLRDDDSELRGLLDSIGVHEAPGSAAMTDIQRARAALELAKIRDRVAAPAPRSRRRPVAALAIVGAAVAALFMWLDPADQPMPHAPQALIFTRPVPTTGSSSHAPHADLHSALTELAQRASEQPSQPSTRPGTASIERWAANSASPTSLVLRRAPLNLVAATQQHAAACTNGWCVLMSVADVFTTYQVSQSDTAQLWMILRLAQGLRSLGRTTDRAGHESVGFAVDRGKIRRIVIADSATGAFRGLEVVDLSAERPIVLSYVAFSVPR